MPRVFVSYSRKSRDAVKLLADDIEALGHIVWFDRELSGGEPWWDRILKEIRCCEVFVLALDADAIESTACRREYEYAAKLNKPVLPVLLSESLSPSLLLPAMSQIQHVEYGQRDHGAALRLAKALAGIPPVGALPDPMPDPPDPPLSYLSNLTEQIATASTLSFEQQSALVLRNL